jgi:AcrR family transcriptional regulator
MRIKDENKTEKIYGAAIKVINIEGLSGASMSKIAKEAELSVATIYLYFENKEDMLNKLYIELKRKLSLTMLQGFDREMPIKVSFFLLWTNYYRFIANNFQDFIFIEQFASSPLILKVSKEEAKKQYQTMGELFEKAKNDAIIADLSSQVIFAFLFVPIAELAKNAYKDNTEIDQQTLASLFELSWKAIAK